MGLSMVWGDIWRFERWSKFGVEGWRYAIEESGQKEQMVGVLLMMVDFYLYIYIHLVSHSNHGHGIHYRLPQTHHYCES